MLTSHLASFIKNNEIYFTISTHLPCNPFSEISSKPHVAHIALNAVHTNWKPTEAVSTVLFGLLRRKREWATISSEPVLDHHDTIAEKLLAAKASAPRRTWLFELGEVN